MASPRKESPYRAPFTFQDAFNYDKDSIYNFLENSILRNNQLNTEEREELTEVWEKIISKQLKNGCKRIIGDTVLVHVHKVQVPVVSIFCAISIVLTITLKAPEIHSPIPYHDWAYALAVVLGKWCRVVKPRNGPGMVCVIYGISSSNPSTSTSVGALPTIVVTCGTTKGPKSGKKDRKQIIWRKERQDFLHAAIGKFPGLGYLEQDGYPPFTTGTQNGFLLEAREDVTSNEILSRFLERTNLTDNAYRGQRFGDCAETIPMAVIAGRCSGHAASIAMTPKVIESMVKGVNLDNTIVLKDPRLGVQPRELQRAACSVCKWEFSALKVIRNITISDNIQVGMVNPLENGLQ